MRTESSLEQYNLKSRTLRLVFRMRNATLALRHLRSSGPAECSTRQNKVPGQEPLISPRGNLLAGGTALLAPCTRPCSERQPRRSGAIVMACPIIHRCSHFVFRSAGALRPLCTEPAAARAIAVRKSGPIRGRACHVYFALTDWCDRTRSVRP